MEVQRHLQGRIDRVTFGDHACRLDRRAWRPLRPGEMPIYAGAAYEAAYGYQPGRVGQAAAQLFSQRQLIDFADKWLSRYRD